MICPKCHKESQTNGAFCPHCGAPLSASEPKKKKKAGKIILIVILSIVALWLVAYGIFLVINNIKDNKVTQDMLDEYVGKTLSREKEIEEFAKMRLNGTGHVDLKMKQNDIIRSQIYGVTLKQLQQKRDWKKVENAEDYEALGKAYDDLYELVENYSKYSEEEFGEKFKKLKAEFDRCYKAVD